MSSKITPFLWFDNQAEEAANFYVSIFKNSEVLNVHRFDDRRPGSEAVVTVASFRLDGQEFMGLNGGPHFKFTEAISFYVNCESQEEIDYYWEKLTDGGEESQCGWLKDKFGVSWQIIPTRLTELLSDPDPVRAGRVTQAMLQMAKIEIAELERAYAG